MGYPDKEAFLSKERSLLGEEIIFRLCHKDKIRCMVDDLARTPRKDVVSSEMPGVVAYRLRTQGFRMGLPARKGSRGSNASAGHPAN